MRGEREEINTVKKILRKENDEETVKLEEVEEVIRIGRYDEERIRPMRVALRSQTETVDILERTLRLRGDYEFKDVCTKKSLNEEGRIKLKEL